MTTKPQCHYCKTDDADLRPYGPGGTWVCFPCGTATPERNATSQAAFGTLLDATQEISPSGAVVVGESSGPRPFDPEELGTTL